MRPARGLVVSSVVCPGGLTARATVTSSQHTMSKAANKAAVTIVVAAVLGAQMYAMFWPADSWWWPFVRYPMYAKSFEPGAAARTHRLRMVACGGTTVSAPVEGPALGYKSFQFRGQIATIADGGPHAERLRARLERRVRATMAQPPCELQIWRRTVTTTATGVDPAVFADPHWMVARSWRLAPAEPAPSFGERE